MTGRVVSVQFLGSLGRVAGRREIEVVVDPDATVTDLIQQLAGTYGRDFSDAVFRAPGELHTHVRVFLNETEASALDRVAPGDAPAEVALLVVPGFEGGS